MLQNFSERHIKMKEIILIKNGELVLKGLNRNTFEDTLIRNIRKNLASIGKFNIKKAQSTIYIEPLEDAFDMNDALERLSKIFGIAAFSKACVCQKDMADIIMLNNIIKGKKMQKFLFIK